MKPKERILGIDFYMIKKGSLKEIIRVLEMIRTLDKTSYPYDGENSRSPSGEYPKKGTRWATPSEMAQELIEELESLEKTIKEKI